MKKDEKEDDRNIEHFCLINSNYIPEKKLQWSSNNAGSTPFILGVTKMNA